MTSDPTRAFVWVWLSDSQQPVVAGRLDVAGAAVTFTYGRTYLERANVISLYEPELPLRPGLIPPTTGTIAGCIADSAPDAWGRRVIMNRRVGRSRDHVSDPSELTLLLESGSDRIGALDFQESPSEYVSRSMGNATIAELAESAARVEQGIPLSPDLDAALLHGTSVGGARPKAILRDGERQLIAKFSSTTDTYPIVKGEFIAMELARRAGLTVASVEMTTALGKDALLIDRFDRPAGGRRAMVSALTILGQTENEAIYGASYADLAHIIRKRFTDPDATLRELFARITFNILVGNNDDHPRNHAGFWDGRMLTLTPAYDICPQPRSGGETRQLMVIGTDGYRMSQLAGCVERSRIYHLAPATARDIIDRQIAVIQDDWVEVCDLAQLTEVERTSFWKRQFLNEYAFYDY